MLVVDGGEEGDTGNGVVVDVILDDVLAGAANTQGAELIRNRVDYIHCFSLSLSGKPLNGDA